jgi:hypothetical protein
VDDAGLRAVESDAGCDNAYLDGSGGDPVVRILPLAAYLLTFILAFSTRMWIPEKPSRSRVPVLALTVHLVARLSAARSMDDFGACVIVVFFAALACHTALVRSRPNAEGATLFLIKVPFTTTGFVRLVDRSTSEVLFNGDVFGAGTTLLFLAGTGTSGQILGPPCSFFFLNYPLADSSPRRSRRRCCCSRPASPASPARSGSVAASAVDCESATRRRSCRRSRPARAPPR